ncbi:MAG: hypothetical protein ACKOYN_05650 [Planctomycetota bacterium]
MLTDPAARTPPTVAVPPLSDENLPTTVKFCGTSNEPLYIEKSPLICPLVIARRLLLATLTGSVAAGVNSIVSVYALIAAAKLMDGNARRSTP